MDKTPFVIWTSRKPNLNHLHILGCKAEARMYNPTKKKLYSRTMSCNFVGFPENSKEYRFYTFTLFTRIIETNNAKFLEDEDGQSCSHQPSSFSRK